LSAAALAANQSSTRKEAMKAEEQTAKDYLEGLDIGSVSFEPDGNIPPDFSVGSSIGVEVRRLNQNYFGEDDPEGLEELAIPLWRILGKETSRFDTQFDGESYWVFVAYERPSQESGGGTAKSVRNALEDFLSRGGHTPDELVVNDNLKLTVYPSSPVQGRVFRLGGGRDRNSGGWLVPMYIDNIAYCIKEKSQKIAPYENRYEIWWLLLIDFMGWGIDDFEESELGSGISSLGRFDRVIVIGNEHGELRLDLEDEAAQQTHEADAATRRLYRGTISTSEAR
jgi:hypothetical protein